MMAQSNGRTDASFGSTVPLWLDGKEVKTSNTYDVISPVTGKVLYQSASASVEDAERAIQSAQNAFQTWSKTKPSVRRDIILRAVEIMESKKDQLSKLLREETGAVDFMFGFQYGLAVEACRSTAGLISAIRGHIPTVVEEGQSAMVMREPYGVVLGVAPWNAPYILGMRAFVGPLAMGNTVILKGSESSPGPYWAIAQIFHEAGLPPGCLNTISHRPQDAAAVTSHIIASPYVKKINFTGSTATGSIIAQQAAKYLKPCLLELGGKAPTIVCEDADIQKAALGCALGAFAHGGQICMSTERILVSSKIAAQFSEALKATAGNVFSTEDGITLVNAAPVEKNKKLIDDAISKGAKIAYGDPSRKEKTATALGPMIIENVKPGMDIYYTESFGPTVSLFEFETEEEAIKLANDTDYGLAASVFTEDLRRGLRIAKQIQSGAVHINSMSVHDEAALPHGGFKKSGYGRFNSVEGMEEWVQTKAVTWMD